MKIMIVTDAWEPQVNGVVRTLKNTTRELTALGHRVELLTPLEFHTIPCPTYPEIRLSLFPRRQAVAARIDEFAPDALHIATEGPLGMAARSLCDPPQAAVHDRVSHALSGVCRRRASAVPITLTYRFLHWFHKPVAGRDGADAGRQDAISKSIGFTNVVLWSRGVDLDIFHPMESKVLNTARPIFLYVGRVAVEKNVEAFLKLDLPGSKWVAGEGPALAELKSRYPEVELSRRADAGRTREGLRGRRRFRVPEPHRHVRARAARSAGVRHAGRGVSGHGPDRRARQRGAGAMNEDLREACLEALKIDRADARAWAERFSWRCGIGAIRRASEAALAAPRVRGERRRVSERERYARRGRAWTAARRAKAAQESHASMSTSGRSTDAPAPLSQYDDGPSRKANAANRAPVALTRRHACLDKPDERHTRQAEPLEAPTIRSRRCPSTRTRAIAGSRARGTR